MTTGRGEMTSVVDSRHLDPYKEWRVVEGSDGIPEKQAIPFSLV